MEKEKTNKGCAIFMIIAVVGSSIFFANKCTNFFLDDGPKTALDSIKSRADSMQIKRRNERIADIQMLINRNMKLREIYQVQTFKAFIINEYEAYFNMKNRYVDCDISEKAQKKYPDSFQEQDAYCIDHKCKLIDWSGQMMEDIISDNDANYIDEVSSEVDKLYQ